MTLFSLIDQTSVRLAPGERILKRDAYQKIQEINQIVEKTLADTKKYKKAAVAEAEAAKEVAEKEGYQEGLERWADELAKVQEEIDKLKAEYESAILKTAIMAAQKVVGREIKLDPKTLVDIVKTSLKAVCQHKRISIYCNAKDFEVLDKARPDLRTMFEELEVLGVYAKEGLESGAYIIETERGIINNSDVNRVWQTLEKAFELAFKQSSEKSNEATSEKED